MKEEGGAMETYKGNSVSGEGTAHSKALQTQLRWQL